MRIEQTPSLEIMNSYMKGSAREEDSVKQSEGTNYLSLDGHSVTATGVSKSAASGISSMDELMENMEQVDVESLKTQMAVMSNTLSPEDYEKLREEGYSAVSDDVKTIVTVMDRIKMQLAEAGVDISCYAFDLSSEKIQAMTGNLAEAQMVASALIQADLPLTADNLKEGQIALEEAGHLTDLSDYQKEYFLASGEAVSIGNLYRTEFVKASENDGAEKETVMNSSVFQQLLPQIRDIIQEAGMEEGQGIEDAGWLFQKGLPITAENMQKYEELSSLRLPQNKTEILKLITRAISEGKRPEEANFIGEGLQERAFHAVSVLREAKDEDIVQVLEKGAPVTIENLEVVAEGRRISGAGEGKAKSSSKDEETLKAAEEVSASILAGIEPSEDVINTSNISVITARRQLEEVRLSMTIEASYTLLKQGISIETEPMEALIKDLSELENRFYSELLEYKQVSEDESNVALAQRTERVVSELQTLPAALLGQSTSQAVTLSVLYEAGRKVQSELLADGSGAVTVQSSQSLRVEMAVSSYETLMTSPRSDLGDSYQKAFRNVDQILEELDLEATNSNQRAVRILAYNELEITKNSVAQMRMADSQVQSLLKEMTPSVTMHLIKRGQNPLETPVTELTSQVREIREENGYSDKEDLAEYLWKLERTEEIPPEQREAYIGMYRLIHQIEKSDGAVIGALVNQGAELTLKNLLTSVKNRQNKGIDATVDDSFGTLSEIHFKENTIASQLAGGFQGFARQEFGPRNLQGVLQKNGVNPSDGEDFLGELSIDLWEEKLAEVKEESSGKDPVEAAYAQAQLEEVEMALDTEESVIRMLQKSGLSTSVSNMVAAQELFTNRNRMYQRLFGITFNQTEDQVDFEEAKRVLLEKFAEAVKSPTELAEAQEKLAELAENAMKNMLPADDKITALDVRELRMLETQVRLTNAFSSQENYEIPVLIADETATVHLQIVRGKRDRGKVNIVLEAQSLGKIAAEVSDAGNRLQLLLVSDKEESLSDIREIADQIKGGLEEKSLSVQSHTAIEKSLDLMSFEMKAMEENLANGFDSQKKEKEDEFEPIKTDQFYAIAKEVIAAIIRQGRTKQ